MWNEVPMVAMGVTILGHSPPATRGKINTMVNIQHYAYALLNVSLLNKSIYIGRYLYKSNDTIYVYIFRNVKPSSYGSPKPGLDLRFRKFFQGAKGYSECNKVWIGGRRLVKADGG